MREVGALRLILVTVVVMVFVFADIPERPGAMVYHFFHVGLLHLAANCIAAWFAFPPGRKDNLLVAVLSYVIATGAFFAALTPTVGLSGVLFATAGLRAPSLRSGWWRQPSSIAFLIAMVATLFVPKIAATVHLAAFLAGVLVGGALRLWKKTSSDYGRVAD